MDGKDISIISQVCIKAAAELFGGSGDAARALGAAEEFYAWVIEKSGSSATGGGVQPAAAPPPAPTFQPDSIPSSCPKCSGPLWDNRATKKGNQPDFKCKNRECGKGVWLTPYQP